MEWRFGRAADGLGGTARTLDDIDGAVPLGPGVVSHNGIAVIDDSDSFLIDEMARQHPDGKAPRTSTSSRAATTTEPPSPTSMPSPAPCRLLPRWALGNWWSRYHPYSADEYLELLDRFDAEQVPLSVAVIDMDWHWVDIDPRFGKGWTGYSLEPRPLPRPGAFLAELHRRGLAVTLNVHPADGVRAFEDAYPQVAAGHGHRPRRRSARSRSTPPTPASWTSYFRRLHHPLEDEGVDFWWLDWQQGSFSRITGRGSVVAAEPSSTSTTRPGAASCRSPSPGTPGRAATATPSGSPATPTSPGTPSPSSPTSPRPRPTSATAGGATTSAATGTAAATTT